MDVVIVDWICTYMVQRASTMTTHVVMMVVQEKTRSYTKRAPSVDVILLVIETYGCFHSCFDSFLPLVHKPISHVINGLF
jgi:hypothetical protein